MGGQVEGSQPQKIWRIFFLIRAIEDAFARGFLIKHIVALNPKP